MTIFTQDEVLVNYDHVTKIQTYGDVYSDDEIEGTVVVGDNSENCPFFLP